MNSLLRKAVLLLWIRDGLATQSTHTSTGSSISQVASPIAAGSHSVSHSSTCPSRTINYITHTLAQQCLKMGQTSISNDATSPTTDSITSNIVVTLTQTIRPPIDTVTLEVSVLNGNAQPAEDATMSVETSSYRDETPKPSLTDAEEDAESPLDNANFLSFEEWKKQNLAKVGQSPDDIGRGQPIDANRPRPGINNALDTLGEEQEINLDFAGFGGGPQVPVVDSHPSRGGVRSSTLTSPDQQDLAAGSLRSKDAGKTCKERSNYASFDCAATILKSNKECKSASSVLVENKDSYMLNTCSAANKFFIVQLCDDIQIDTIVLANYEFFSSSFRHFRISVSDRYPVKMEKWKDLGTFEARNTREIQAFLIQNPIIWARYLRIEFLSHYGTEYYCPVSVLRVHGTTMWEDYRHQEEVARGEDEEATLEVEALATPPVLPAGVEPTYEVTKTAAEVVSSEETLPSVHFESTQSLPATNSAPVGEASPTHGHSASNDTGYDGRMAETETITEVAGKPNITIADTVTESPEPSKAVTSASHSTTGEIANGHSIAQNANTSSTTSPLSPPATTDTTFERGPNGSHTTTTHGDRSSSPTNETSTVLTDQSISSTSTGPANQTASSTNTTRAAASVTVSQPPQPSTQESFFKSFHKRLQQLESNSTWSLQYIEEQSRILRDAFTKVEKRQLATTTKFLSQLNSTVMAELHGFRQSYDQLWQSTVIELEGQREAYQNEMLALSTRLTMVADELVWQKRMGIVQSTLLLLCLALAIFTRSENGFLEVPLMQQMMNRSSTALRSGWESPPNSPSPDSRSPVSLFRRRIWRAGQDVDRSASDTEVSRPQSRDHPDISVEPPSPNAGYTQEDYFDEQEDSHSPPGQEPCQGKRTSPKRQRKKAKKPLASPHSHGRAKSPLAL